MPPPPPPLTSQQQPFQQPQQAYMQQPGFPPQAMPGVYQQPPAPPPAPAPAPPPAPPQEQGASSTLLTETRRDQTEVRLEIGKIATKIDDILTKVRGRASVLCKSQTHSGCF